MNDGLTPTSGSEWREKVRGGVVLRFPSGFVGRVRSVQPSVLFETGTLPDSLTPIVAEMMEGGAGDLSPQSIDMLQGQMDLVNAICRSAMLEPRIVDDPQSDDEIGIGDLEWADKLFLTQTLGATTHDLELFRQKQIDDVDALGATERYSDTSE